MKIFLVISSLSSGGAERVMSDMANYWAEKGYSVSLVTLNPWVDDFYNLNEKVSRIPFKSLRSSGGLIGKISFNIRRAFQLRELLKEINPDVVLSFMDVTNINTIIASSGLNIKVVVSERIDPEANALLNKFWFNLRRFLYKRADVVVAQTKNASVWLDQNCQIQSHVIPNPVRKLVKRDVERGKTIVSIGRLDKQKGHDFLIKSFSDIEKKHPNWTLEIYGEGAEKQSLNKLISDLNLSSKVYLKGVTHDVEDVLSKAGIFVLASRFEGFPNVLLEAMSLECPVISTNCKSGPSEIIKDGVNGYLVDVDDQNKMTKVMAFLIESRSEREKLSALSGLVRDEYGQDKIMKKWEALFHSNDKGK